MSLGALIIHTLIFTNKSQWKSQTICQILESILDHTGGENYIQSLGTIKKMAKFVSLNRSKFLRVIHRSRSVACFKSKTNMVGSISVTRLWTEAPGSWAAVVSYIWHLQSSCAPIFIYITALFHWKLRQTYNQLLTTYFTHVTARFCDKLQSWFLLLPRTHLRRRWNNNMGAQNLKK